MNRRRLKSSGVVTNANVERGVPGSGRYLPTSQIPKHASAELNAFTFGARHDVGMTVVEAAVGEVGHQPCVVRVAIRMVMATQTVLTALRKLTRKSGIRVLVS